MCGIMGASGVANATSLLVDGLKRLEYRGYDSAGVATLVDGAIACRRSVGKLVRLQEKLMAQPLAGTTGIGHTRWATHGRATEANAHPHSNGRVAVVHNGIIENHQELRDDLVAAGVVFTSETDTEVIVHLLTQALDTGLAPQQAMAAVLPRLRGMFALAVIFAGHDGLLLGARRGCPLAVGIGAKRGVFLGSDALALAPLAPSIMYLDDGDWVVVDNGKVQVFNIAGQPVLRPTVANTVQSAASGRGHYPHYMLKEIYEQPMAIGDTLATLLDDDGNIKTPSLPFDWNAIDRLTILACGTAYHAGLVAKYWFEHIARIPCEVDIASEFRYRTPPMPARGAVIALSQSGETADTLAAVQYAKEQGQRVLAVVNVPTSSLARMADTIIPTMAGPEVSVASTKAYTTQLTVMLALALAAGMARGTISAAAAQAAVQALQAVPGTLSALLQSDTPWSQLAATLARADEIICLGRGLMFPLALEGALKLKEITYIAAEGYAAGEMKHGPIALIDEGTPVIVLAPSDALFDKTTSNIAEIRARGAQVMALSDAAGLRRLGVGVGNGITMPTVHPAVMPLLYVVPLQLLAYHTAVARGTDVDQPRNLAKSVVVE